MIFAHSGNIPKFDSTFCFQSYQYLGKITSFLFRVKSDVQDVPSSIMSDKTILIELANANVILKTFLKNLETPEKSTSLVFFCEKIQRSIQRRLIKR